MNGTIKIYKHDSVSKKLDSWQKDLKILDLLNASNSPKETESWKKNGDNLLMLLEIFSKKDAFLPKVIESDDKRIKKCPQDENDNDSRTYSEDEDDSRIIYECFLKHFKCPENYKKVGCLLQYLGFKLGQVDYNSQYLKVTNSKVEAGIELKSNFLNKDIKFIVLINQIPSNWYTRLIEAFVYTPETYVILDDHFGKSNKKACSICRKNIIDNQQTKYFNKLHYDCWREWDILMNKVWYKKYNLERYNPENTIKSLYDHWYFDDNYYLFNLTDDYLKIQQEDKKYLNELCKIIRKDDKFKRLYANNYKFENFKLNFPEEPYFKELKLLEQAINFTIKNKDIEEYLETDLHKECELLQAKLLSHSYFDEYIDNADLIYLERFKVIN